MKNWFIYTSLFLLIISGCSDRREILEKPVKPDLIKKTESIGYWLDVETETVHKIISSDGVEKVVSIIKYKKGRPLEVMKIISSESSNGKIHWIYFVPSTEYIVELTTLLRSDTGINIEWKNRSAEGEEDSGRDLLVRCNENGVAAVQGNYDDNEDGDVSDDFSLFHKIE